MKKFYQAAFLAAAITCLLGAPLAFAEGEAQKVQREKSTSLSEFVSFSGAIEVEAAYTEDFEGVSESSIDLATAEFALEARLTKWGAGIMAIEWDGDEDKLNIDEAFILVGNEDEFPLIGQFGRFIVPFGVYEGNTISDPLTKVAFETKEDAAMATLGLGDFYGNLYVFNGDTNEGGGSDTIEHFGINVGYEMRNDNLVFGAGMGYINSVFDSDGLTDGFPDSIESDYAGGFAVNAKLGIAEMIGIFAEYITALDPVNGVEPSAIQLEATYVTEVAEREIFFSLGYSKTDELGGVLPESRITATAGIGLTEGLGLTVEYGHDEDYNISDGGTGEGADTFIVQLAYEF